MYSTIDYPGSVKNEIYDTHSLSSKKLVIEWPPDSSAFGIGDSEMVQLTFNKIPY